jgi:hypothetical protein
MIEMGFFTSVQEGYFLVKISNQKNHDLQQCVLIAMVDSMEVEIFIENEVVPLVLFVKDVKVVHDHTFSNKFKL